jgi:hypothetical protein
MKFKIVMREIEPPRSENPFKPISIMGKAEVSNVTVCFASAFGSMLRWHPDKPASATSIARLIMVLFIVNPS